MKILVVQLLRLGDIIMSAPIISGLKQKYPTAEVHVLAFRQFAQVENLFADKIHWHWIDRDALQKSLGDAQKPFFHAQDVLTKTLNPLRAAKFDQIYNLTQTKMSGWISTYIQCKETIGLHYDERAQVRFGSPWFQYLNDHIAAGQGEIFHYVDLFRFACDLEEQEKKWNLNRAAIENSFDGPYVLVQPLTSDKKKNYPIEKWKQVFNLFQMSRPKHSIGILAAPSEVKELTEAFGSGSKIQIIECTLGQALTLMDKAELLVTGDTSVKHLACASLVPVVELSLGSSDYRKTGIYKTGSYILQGKTQCGPCPHSSPCSQASHLCSTNLAPEAVSLAMHLMLGHPGSDSELAEEFTPQVGWLESYISPMGFWLARDVQAPSIEVDLLRCIEKSTWKFLLQRELSKTIAGFGTESVLIKRTFQERFSNFSNTSFREKLDFLESETVATDQNVNTILISMKRWMEKPTDPIRQEEYLETVREFCEANGNTGTAMTNWLGASQLLQMNGKKEMSFERVRRLQNQLAEMVQRTQIRLRLIRSLKSQSPDKV